MFGPVWVVTLMARRLVDLLDTSLIADSMYNLHFIIHYVYSYIVV